ncbi:putative ribosomal protein S6 [Helianthus anomalus]
MASSSCILTSTPLLQTLSPFSNNKLTHSHHQTVKHGFQIKAQTLDFSGTFFEGGLGGKDDSPKSVATAVEEKEEPQCPPGLRPYETMEVLRPDMSEDECLSLT